MKHGKYLVFSILYSNLFLNEACKRGWSSILKGSQQGTVAVRENLKEKSLCSFLSWLWRKRRKKCWMCSCSWGLWYIQGAFFLTIPPHFQYQNKKKTCTANEDHFPPFQLWIGSFPGWWGCRGPGFVGLEWFVKMMWNFEGHFIWWSSLTWYGNDITVLQYDDHFCH